MFGRAFFALKIPTRKEVVRFPEKSPGSTQQSYFNAHGSSLNHSKFIAACRVMLVRDRHLPFEQSTLSDSRPESL
jgi:hypothetical protein